MRTRDTTAHRTALAGALALAPAPLLLPAPAPAAPSAQEACPAKPGPHNLGQLAASFNDQGDQDPSNDTIEATLTLCGKAGAKSAYELSLDGKPPLFSDADRNLDGTVDRRDFCVQTRDAIAGLDAGKGTGVGTATLMPGTGGAPDQVKFSVPVDAIASGLARNGQTQVYLWAETRLVAAIPVQPFSFMANRNVVDRLPVPNVKDGCALPQAAGEV